MIETPYVVINYDVVMSNINKMAETIKNNNCKLRPHVKTHKTPEFARMQLAAGADGVTVAKLSEAEVMVENDITDVFIAYPVIGATKVQRVLNLIEKADRIIVGVDSLEGASALSKAAMNTNKIIEIRMEINTGFNRTGVAYEKAVDFAKQLNVLPGVRLTGIFTFKTLTYKGQSTLNCQLAGIEEGEMMAGLAERLRAEGIGIQDVSVGSTPTATIASQIDGITEVRPGSYIFNDMTTVQLGVCEQGECAATVCATVVSNAVSGQIVIDAGSKVFAGDVSPGQYGLQGYGKILEWDHLLLRNINEEHGMIKFEEGAEVPMIGDRVRVIPNHVCATVNLLDNVYLYKDGNYQEIKVQARGKVY